MLLEFTVGNYKSYKDEITISFTKHAGTEFMNNLHTTTRSKVNKVNMIYGGNASGKTTLLEAIAVYQGAIMDGGYRNEYNTVLGGKKVSFNPHWQQRTKDIKLEGKFSIGNDIYTYGFKFNPLTNIFSSEKLSKNEKLIYEISSGVITVGDKGVASALSKNISNFRIDKSMLGLRTLATFANVKGANDFWHKAIQKIKVVINSSNMEHHDNSITVADVYENDEGVKFLNKAIKMFDVNVDKIEFEKNDQGRHTYKVRVKTCGTEIWVRKRDLSSGTIKIIKFLQILWSCNENNYVLLYDELDNSMHPLVLNRLLKKMTTNKFNMQLITTLHSVSPLYFKEFRRDAFTFIEKEDCDSTVFNLTDIRINNEILRTDKDLVKAYLKGEIGAVPDVNQTV